MNELKVSSQKILEELATRFPGKQEFRTREVKEAAQSLGYTGKDWNPIFNTAEKIGRGVYNLSSLIKPVEQPIVNSNVVAMSPQSVVNKERTYAAIDPTFVPWGSFSDVKKVIQ